MLQVGENKSLASENYQFVLIRNETFTNKWLDLERAFDNFQLGKMEFFPI